ncbi:MAG: TetR/AcrR family transcriptional regulator C-terminal domain-containing protein [Maritimibacter sp.]
MKRVPLTPEKIVETALLIADQEPFEKLSMRRLAGALNVTAMSLYNHVSDKDALIDMMLNRVVDKMDSPQGEGDWQEEMRQRATSMRRELMAHRWATPLLMSRIVMGEAILRDIDATVGCLVGGGFSYAQADWARTTIDSYVYGYIIQEQAYPVEPEAYQEAASAHLPQISQADYPHMHEAARQIIDGDYDGKTDFGFGLDLVLDGLRRWGARAPAPTPPASPR